MLGAILPIILIMLFVMIKGLWDILAPRIIHALVILAIPFFPLSFPTATQLESKVR